MRKIFITIISIVTLLTLTPNAQAGCFRYGWHGYGWYHWCGGYGYGGWHHHWGWHHWHHWRHW